MTSTDRPTDAKTDTKTDASTGPTSDPIVIVGSGHAGAQLCAVLAAAGAGARVHLVCAEPHLPYQRPPLSKAFLKSPDEGLQAHRAATWYAEAGITLHLGDAAVAIDRAARTLRLASGRVLPYGPHGQLVLATGARVRALPGVDASLANVALLRGADDAQRLRGLLGQAKSLTVLGGGFIGLEIAATARAMGLAVQVLEAAPRLLARSVSPEIATHVLDTHRSAGITVHLGTKVSDIVVADGRVQSLQVNGQTLPIDLLVLGIGATPDTTLAEGCGLACSDGVLVDAHLRSSDPAVLALGDCARFAPAAGAAHLPPTGPGGTLRLESVQNANDQARTACATLLGRSEPYAALPWFWSEQGSLRLQMAGLMPPPSANAPSQAARQAGHPPSAAVERHRRPGPNASSFSVLHYVDGQLRCVESVNAPMDHMVARKLLEAGRSPTPQQACDPAIPLKQWL